MSNSKDSYDLLKKKLAENGIMVKWWVRKYLPKMTYGTAMSQLNGINPMSPYVWKAINDYLNKP